LFREETPFEKKLFYIEEKSLKKTLRRKVFEENPKKKTVSRRTALSHIFGAETRER
jgi:hypothetical protein